jgi:hypothetical protein
MSKKSVPTEAEYEAAKSYFADLRRQHAAGTLGPEKIAVVEKQFPTFDWTVRPQDLSNIALSLPNIAELVEHGQITIGTFPSVGCAAVASGRLNPAAASGRHKTLATLVRRKGETLAQLLTRLELAIAMALEDKIFTDEVKLSCST